MGDDFISLWGGNDSVDGGAGSDTIEINDSEGATTVAIGNNTIAGGEGGTDYDVLSVEHLSGAVTVSCSGDEAGTLTDGTGTVTFSQIESLIHTDHADSVDGTADNAGLDIRAGAGDRFPLGRFRQ